MKRNKLQLEIFYDRAFNFILIALVVVAMLVLLLRILTHFPFFDETLHLHFLWLISSGIKPNIDFLCTYPVLGYIVTLPFMRLLPESAFVVLALRYFSLLVAALIGYLFYRHGRRVSNDPAVSLIPYILIVAGSSIGTYMVEYSVDHIAALAALGAMMLLIGKQRPLYIASAAALCVVSLIIMPKYALQLFFCLLGGAVACYLQTRRFYPVAGAVFGGGACALSLVLVLFYVTDLSFFETFRYSHLLQYNHSKLLGRVGGDILRTSGLAHISVYLFSHPVLACAIMLGMCGWIRKVAREREAATLLPVGGILLGTLLSSLLINDFMEQYTAPLLFSLALMVAYSGLLFKTPAQLRAYRLVLVLGALVTILPQIRQVANEFLETPYNSRGDSAVHRRNLGQITMGPTGILALNAYSDLLELLPESETVVAVWPYHPIFRRHASIVTFDGEPSLARALSIKDPIRHAFESGRFRETLDKKPPGFIVTERMEKNYPAGWKEQAEDFLRQNPERYVLRKTRFYDGYIRRDLIK